MSTWTLLTLISAIGAAALFIALVAYLWVIAMELEAIGGKGKKYGEPASDLSRIRLGVRAIETHTGWLRPQAGRLNAGLSDIRDGLRAIDSNLASVIASVSKQEPS